MPSLAKIRKSVFSLMVSTDTSGSELRCFFKLLSPKALATASCPSTRGTSPAINKHIVTVSKIVYKSLPKQKHEYKM